MRRNLLVLVLLIIGGVSLAAHLEPWFQTWSGSRTESANLLAVALGDSRRLFAKHVYAKADAYFHNGYYPSIFDYRQDLKGNVLSQRIGLTPLQESRDQTHFLGENRDWIDAFARHFYPSRHTHLGEDAPHDAEPDHSPGPEGQTNPAHGETGHQHGPECDHEHHDHDHEAHSQPGTAPGDEREMLPWLRLSASLDPNHVETYVVAAYWLRRQLGKTDQAEILLREGLRANPANPEILFELGRIYAEDRKDVARARNVWELAIRSWTERESKKPDPNTFLYAQILGNLARLEEEQGNWTQARRLLEQLLAVSPNKASIQRWLVELAAKEARP